MKTILISICLAATPLTVAQDKPIVIVIVADDLGYADGLAPAADKGRSAVSYTHLRAHET